MISACLIEIAHLVIYCVDIYSIASMEK